jgi:hypothetical protein
MDVKVVTSWSPRRHTTSGLRPAVVKGDLDVLLPA